MSELSERSRFESRFTEDIIEVAVVTGSRGIGARGVGEIIQGNCILWNASIGLIAWKNLMSNESVIKEEIELEWFVDNEGWEKTRGILNENTVVKLKVRRGENSMMLLQVIETEYRDDDLELILQDAIKPVVFNDKVLGEFILDKSVKTFEKKISWVGEIANLLFDWEEEELMKSSLKTAQVLLEAPEEWNMKMRMYASEKLLELANDWLDENEEAEIDEITKEMFMDFMELDTICVYPEGKFRIYFNDGNMFMGHCITLNGNTNGEFTSADIIG
jgi:hypothetical protein